MTATTNTGPNASKGGRKERKTWEEMSTSQHHRRLKKRFQEFFSKVRQENIPDDAVAHFLRKSGLFSIITMVKKAWTKEIISRNKMANYSNAAKRFNSRRRELVSSI